EENEYWKTSDDEYISSKDLNIDLFEKELINKLKDDKTLFNIRKDSFNFSFSIKKLLVFSQNSFAEIEKINSTSEIPLSNQYLCSDNSLDYKNYIFQDNINIESKFIDIIDSIFDGSNIFHKKIKRKLNPS